MRTRSIAPICWIVLASALSVACGSAAKPSGDGATADAAGDGSGGDVSGDVAAVSCTADNTGATCDDKNACTGGDKCAAGACVGTAVDCSDGITCTDDSCDPAKGCVHKTKGCVIAGVCLSAGDVSPTDACRTCQPGVSASAWSVDIKLNCDDGDPCTQFDSCKQDGSCGGAKLGCDDGNVCTLDACTAKDGCTSTPADGNACEDNNPCTLDDVCKGSKCQAGATPLVCDDKNPCTKDSCAAGKGCTAANDPTACDDNEGCTIDSCDPTTGCKHVNLQVGDPCSTGDLCITGASCSPALKCQGGSPLSCEDKNVCTDDSCKPDKGCIHAINKLSCDDGEWCTYPDLCTGGQCIGVKGQSCPFCSKIFSDFDGKLTQFQIGVSGNPGDGIDVDGDPTTCAPDGDCSAGIDNAASVLSLIVNDPLIASVNNGQFLFVAELAGYQGENVPFTLNLYYANMDITSLNVNCDAQKDVCNWDAMQTAFTASCQPKFSFKDAMVQNGVLTAGGADTLFAMDASILGAKNATLYVKGARVEAKVVFTPDGKAIQGMAGALGGAVPTPVIVDIINAMDDSVFASFGGKAGALTMVQQLLTVDIDTDGDGTKDASSIGLRFSALGAKLVGTKY